MQSVSKTVRRWKPIYAVPNMIERRTTHGRAPHQSDDCNHFTAANRDASRSDRSRRANLEVTTRHGFDRMPSRSMACAAYPSTGKQIDGTLLASSLRHETTVPTTTRARRGRRFVGLGHAFPDQLKSTTRTPRMLYPAMEPGGELNFAAFRQTSAAGFHRTYARIMRRDQAQNP